MATKRKTYSFRKGEVLEVEEYHDGNYGAPGESRTKRRKPTPEEMHRINLLNKQKRCRHRMLEYFHKSDHFCTWNYDPEERPPDMKGALKDWQKAIRIVKREYKKRGHELRWIRNIEKGSKGAWHIHVMVNAIPGGEGIMVNAWPHGGTHIKKVVQCKQYSEDMNQLASYITKDETTVETKKDGTKGKPRLSEASYNTSKNMPLKPPKEKKLVRWREEVKPKKGYYISSMHEGINPIGLKYRRYTMVRLI